jgi:hypothetical protein
MEFYSPLAMFYCCVGILAIATIAGISFGVDYGAIAWLDRNRDDEPRDGCAVLVIAGIVFVLLLTIFWKAIANIPLF